MMLVHDNVNSYYGSSQILFDVSLTVGDGEVVTLLGRNGMGKTTTVSTIMGVVPAKRGTITFENAQIQSLPSYRIARVGLALVPEGRQIFPNLSVYENLIATSANWGHIRDPWTLGRVFDLFPALKPLQSRMAGVLSGGEQQMLSIARALMTNPKLLILDEATEGLAPKIRTEIWHALQRIKDAGQAVLVIDKNIRALSRIAHRHYILEKGRVVWTGDSQELTRSDDLRHRFLGV
jgi:branched-chain amino acid transport system ATP-binding protein